MTANPWDKFFWNDWENDPALKLCSLSAQGLWMRMLCICAKAEPKGFLLVAGRPLSPADVSSLVGKPEAEVELLLSELASAGVFSRDRKHRIYNRRMVRAEQKTATARANGKKGGNPSLRKDWDNSPLDNPQDKPPDKTQKPEAICHKQQKETRELEREFSDQFWPAYPNKVGKPAALASYRKARDKASLDEILAGLRRYIESKPADRAWCNPSTFLNQERWADEPALPLDGATGAGVHKNGTGYYVAHGTEEYAAWSKYAHSQNDGDLIYGLKANPAHVPRRWPPRI